MVSLRFEQVSEAPDPTTPFSSAKSPVAIHATAKQVDSWVTVRGSAAAPPPSPVVSSAPAETLRLIPYGATHGLSLVELPTLQAALKPLKTDDPTGVPAGFDCNLRRAAHAHAQRILTDQAQLSAVRDGLRLDFFCGAESPDPAPAGPVFAHHYEDPSASLVQLWVAPQCTQSDRDVVRAGSPCGDDVSGDGSQGKPYASPTHARDELRRRRKGSTGSNATVWFSAGLYFLNQTLELGPLDSNTMWARHGDGAVTFSGGRPIPNGAWAPSATNKGAFTATVGTAWGDDGISSLFVDDKRYWRARWPNANPDDGPVWKDHGPPGAGEPRSSLIPRGWALASGSIRPLAGGAPVTRIRWANVTRNFTSTGIHNGSYHWTEGGAANERFDPPASFWASQVPAGLVVTRSLAERWQAGAAGTEITDAVVHTSEWPASW